jgi:gluconolactonase
MADLIPAEFEVLDPGFVGVGGDRSVARLFSGGRWLEGPGYHPAGRFLLFSDIPKIESSVMTR